MDYKINVELLIRLIEDKPVIWDKSLEIYKNKVLRESAWREISEILKEDFEEMDETQTQDFGKMILKKWTQIRDSWSRDVKKRKDQNKNGSSANKPYKYSDQLSFLKKIVDTEVDQETRQGAVGDDGEGSSRHAEHQPGNTTNGEIQYKNRKKRGTQISDKGKKIIKRKQPEIEDKIIRFRDGNGTKTEDPILLFFKSLLPITATLNIEETLQFQAGVINLLQSIKRQRQNNYYPNSDHGTGPYQSTGYTSITTAAPYQNTEYMSNSMDSSSPFSETTVTDVQSPISFVKTEEILEFSEP